MLNYVILWEDKVDSDDTLYFGDTLFHKDLADITTMVVNMLVTLLDQAADKVRSHTRHACCNMRSIWRGTFYSTSWKLNVNKSEYNFQSPNKLWSCCNITCCIATYSPDCIRTVFKDVFLTSCGVCLCRSKVLTKLLMFAMLFSPPSMYTISVLKSCLFFDFIVMSAKIVVWCTSLETCSMDG
jgi:hypothetical protein